MEAGIWADVLVGVLMSMGANLGATARGINDPISGSSCFISADGLRFGLIDALTDADSDSMVLLARSRGLSGERDIPKEYRVTAREFCSVIPKVT